MEFIERRPVGPAGKIALKQVGYLSGQPVGIQVGTEIEIDYQEYKVVAINPIISSADRELVYQIHVERIEDSEGET